MSRTSASYRSRIEGGRWTDGVLVAERRGMRGSSVSGRFRTGPIPEGRRASTHHRADSPRPPPTGQAIPRNSDARNAHAMASGLYWRNRNRRITLGRPESRSQPPTPRCVLMRRKREELLRRRMIRTREDGQAKHVASTAGRNSNNNVSPQARPVACPSYLTFAAAWRRCRSTITVKHGSTTRIGLNDLQEVSSIPFEDVPLVVEGWKTRTPPLATPGS